MAVGAGHLLERLSSRARTCAGIATKPAAAGRGRVNQLQDAMVPPTPHGNLMIVFNRGMGYSWPQRGFGSYT